MAADRKVGDAETAVLDISGPCFAEFRKLWEAGELCDVALRAGCDPAGPPLPVHRLVLAAASAYFRGLFLGAGRHMTPPASFSSANAPAGFEDQPELPVVELQAVEPQQLLAVVTAIYTQRLHVTVDSVQSLVACSDFLGVTSVTDACCTFLERQLDVQSCLTTLAVAAHYNCICLIKHTLAFVCAHFSKAAAADGAAAQLAALPPEVMHQLLSSETLQASSEVEIAQVAVSWLEARWPCSAVDVDRLLSTVRLPPGQLRSEIESGEICFERAQCRDLLLALLVERQSAAQARLPPICPRHKLAVTLLAAGGHDPSWHSLRITELYRPRTDDWVDGPTLPQGYSFASGAALSSDAFIVGGATHGTSVARLQNLHWEALPSCLTPRLHAAVAACGDHLFVLGGRAVDGTLRSTELLQLGCKQWRPGPAMAVPRTALAAATIQETVFVIGGQSGKSVYPTIEQLDGPTGRFTLLPHHMQAERKYTSCSAFAGRLYVVGGMTKMRTRMASVEAYDPREGRWTRLPPMAQARASCGTAVLGDELFAVAGSGENDTILSSAEIFSPIAGKWRPCCPLNLARSNLALLPLCD